MSAFQDTRELVLLTLSLSLLFLQFNNVRGRHFKSAIFYLIKNGFLVSNQTILGSVQVLNEDECLSHCLLHSECSGVNLDFGEATSLTCTILNITSSVGDLSYQPKFGVRYFQRGQTQCMSGSICKAPSTSSCSFGRCINEYSTKEGFQCISAREQMFILQNASQSTTAYQGSADKAIDRAKDPTFLMAQCTHTLVENNAWWKADLGFIVYVNSAIITNRGDCCRYRLLGGDLLVLRTKLAMKSWCAKVESVGTINITLSCSKPTLGDGILVKRVGFGVLTLCEIELYGIDASDCTV